MSNQAIQAAIEADTFRANLRKALSEKPYFSVESKGYENTVVCYSGPGSHSHRRFEISLCRNTYYNIWIVDPYHQGDSPNVYDDKESLGFFHYHLCKINAKIRPRK